ncbi:MAG TPA: hypothetical protein VGM90_38035 [Kofleriaceae bacterium]|jgi:hypothetical protein
MRAKFAGPAKAPDEHPALAGKRGLGRVKAPLAELFIYPMIVQYEDKPKIAARVAGAGVSIDLRPVAREAA